MWLRSITNLPIIIKGLVTAEDARLAAEYGASGVVISHHGEQKVYFAFLK